MFDVIKWLAETLVELILLVINLGLKLVELVINLFPSPEGMPGLPGQGAWVFDLSWVASVLDINAFNQLVALWAGVQTAFIVVKGLKWVKSWVW